MRARFCVQALVGNAKALNRATADEMFPHDVFRIFRAHVAVPDGFGVNNDCWPVLALIETARLVDAYLARETSLF